MRNNNRERAFGPIYPTSDPNSVDALSAAYIRMSPEWDPIVDLLGGTLRMRQLREKWLMQETSEDIRSYEARLARSFLFEALSDAIDKVSGKPFTKPVTIVGSELPEPLDAIVDDVDLNGTDLTTFAATTFADCVTYGLTFCLVDYPNVGTGLNLKQVRDGKIRPYFTFISATDLIGFRSEPARNGGQRLTEIRILGTRTVPDGEYGEKEEQTVRRITAPPLDAEGNPVGTGTWQLYKQDVQHDVKTDIGKRTYTLVESGTHTYPGIPLVVGYSEPRGFMRAQPPMSKLAWKNIEHWQKSSDHNNILRFTRFGILFGSGFEEERIEKGITIGPNRFIGDTNPEADLKYVEHTGASIGVGMDDLKALEDQMEVLGMQPFQRPSTSIRATGQAIGESKNTVAIQEWIRRHEGFLYDCFKTAATWVKTKLAEDTKIEIYSEFALGLSRVEDMTVISEARKRKDIDRRTFLEEAKRRGIFGETLDPDEVERRLEEEAESDLETFREAMGGPAGMDDPDADPGDSSAAGNNGNVPKTTPDMGKASEKTK